MGIVFAGEAGSGTVKIPRFLSAVLVEIVFADINRNSMDDMGEYGRDPALFITGLSCKSNISGFASFFLLLIYFYQCRLTDEEW